MAEKNDGGPAFPRSFESHGLGMSLRDYFAAKAMPDLIGFCQTGEGWSVDNVAENAYELADAMLRVRNAT